MDMKRLLISIIVKVVSDYNEAQPLMDTHECLSSPHRNSCRTPTD
jgi:hypothetical protein